MPYNEEELVDVSPNGRGFGAKSEERIAIINFMEEGLFYDTKEVTAETNDKKAGIRLGVMFRDKIVKRKYTKDGVVTYALDEKGVQRKAKQNAENAE